MTDFFIMTTVENNTHCWIPDEPEALSKTGWRIAVGVPMEHRYPSDTVLELDPADGRKIPDLIPNALRYCLVSSRFKLLIEKESGANVEWLPFSIKNAKGRLEKDTYYCANILDIHDCIDLERSDYDYSAIRPDTLGHLGMLYVVKDKIPSDALLFRLGRMPNIILVRDNLRAVIDAAGISGMSYVGMGEECFFS